MVIYDDSYKKTQGLQYAVISKSFRKHSKPQIHTVMHYHSDMELLFIDQGEADFLISGKLTKAKKGDLVVVNPYEVHSGETAGINLSFRCIDFDMLLLGLPESDRILSGNLKYDSVVAGDEVEKAFADCYDAVLNRDKGWELKARGSLLVLFSCLTDNVRSATVTKDQAFARQMVDYLEAHYSEDLTSAEPAEELFYNQSYFCRKFKKMFSQSFGDYLNTFRVAKAKEFLKLSSVSETATRCGFQNISYFSRVFKSVTGTTPTEYKRIKYELRKDK